MTNYYEYIDLLQEENASCIIIHNDAIIFKSTKKGVAPMLNFYNLHNTSYSNLIVVDKIMGRGAVLLAKMIGAEKIITPLISKTALELAKFYQMGITFDRIVPYIINRNQNGQCPIEKSVLDITDVDEGYLRITNTLKKLSNQ
jgi:hypothetical protein